MTSLKTWLRAHRRGLLVGALVLLAIQLVYLLAANVFLASALGQRTLNPYPQRFHITWTRAWSLYPGHIHATGLRLGGHARNIVWSSQARAASGRIKLLPLLARRLSFGPIDANQVSLTLDRNAPMLAPRVSTSKFAPWDLHFDSIGTDTLQSLQLAGWRIDQLQDSRVRYAMDKTLRQGEVAILPSTLTARSARVSYGDTVLVRQARLDYRMTMAAHTRAEAHGLERMRFVDARLQLSGIAPGLSIAGGDQDFLDFSTGRTRGRVSADLLLKDGVLAPGGRLDWSAPLVLQDGQPDPSPERLQVHAEVEASGVALRAQVPKRADSDQFIDAQLTVAERSLQKTSVRELLRKTSGQIDLRWHFRTLAWLNPLLSDTGWLRLDGQADLAAQLRLRQGKLADGSRAAVEKAQLQADLFDTVLSASARATAKVEGQRTTVDFTAHKFQLAPHAAPTAPYVAGNNFHLNLVASEDLSQFRRTLQAKLDFNDARIPDLRAYNRNLPGDSLRFEGGQGTLAADLALDARGRMQRGRLRLRGQQAQLLLGPSRLVGDLDLDTRLRQSGADAHDYRIDALELHLDRVRAGDPQDPPWWAQLSVDNGSLQWQQPFRMQGDARVQMKDVSLLLTLFSERSAFPKWIGHLIDAGRADATAKVTLAGNTFTVDQLHASNQRIGLDARLRVADGKPHGALYAKWGVLGLGVDLRGAERKFKLANAKAWYDGLPPFPPVELKPIDKEPMDKEPMDKEPMDEAKDAGSK